MNIDALLNLPHAPMKRIILHWTAGSYKPNDTDLAAYHFVIDGDGKWHPGVNIAKNSGKLQAGYAAHTLNLNTDSIGVSMACMGGAVESPFNAGKWPMKVEQLHSLIAGVAKLSKTYGIAVTAKTILSHAEVQGTLGVQQRNKWDYTVLPFDSKVKGAKAIGDYIRDQIQMEINGQLAPDTADPWPAMATVQAVKGTKVYVNSDLKKDTGFIPEKLIVTVLKEDRGAICVRTPGGYTVWAARANFKLIDGPVVSVPTTPAIDSKPEAPYTDQIRVLLDKIDAEKT